MTATDDCTDPAAKTCKTAEYENGRYQVEFDNGLAKWIVVNDPAVVELNGPQALGFDAAPPTFERPDFQSWRSAAMRGTATGPLLTIPGIEQINKNHSRGDPAQITVSVFDNYSKPF